MSTWLQRVSGRRRMLTGPNVRPTVAERALFPYMQAYAAAGTALYFHADRVPSEFYGDPDRPMLYTDHPGDDAGYEVRNLTTLSIIQGQLSLDGTTGQRESGFAMMERGGNRLLVPSKSFFHPNVMEDDSTNKACMSFGRPERGGSDVNALTQANNGALRPMSRVDMGGVERNNGSFFSADQAFSVALKFRIPAVGSTVNGIPWDTSTTGGSFLGGASTTVDNNPDIHTHLGSGLLNMRNRTSTTGYAGVIDLRDGLVHTFIGGYDPVANHYQGSLDEAGFDTQASSVGIIGSDAAALKLTIGGSGGNVAALNNRFCGFMMCIIFIPSFILVSSSAARAAALAVLAER